MNDISSSSNSSNLDIVFLLGIPRSGTTLLSALLNQHPAIHCPPEPWLMLALQSLGDVPPDHPAASELVKGATAEFLGSDRNRLLAEVATGIYRDRLQEIGKTVFVDKTPRYYLCLNEISLIESAKFIFLKRNPLDIAASYQDTWNIDIAEIIKDEISSSAIFDYVLGINRLLDFSEQNKDRVCLVEYESLVTSPDTEISRVLRHLDLETEHLDWSIPDLAAYRHSAFGDKKILEQPKVHTQSVGTYRSKLKGDQIAQLLDALGEETFVRLGYGDVYRSAVADFAIEPRPEYHTRLAERVEQLLSARWTQTENAGLRAQLLEKDRIITSLQSSQQRIAEVVLSETSSVVTSDASLEEIRQKLATDSHILEIIKPLHRALEEKEQFIQQQAKELKRRHTWSIGRRVRTILRPRLGNLNQHGPVPIQLPASYDRPIKLASAPKISIVTPSFNQGRFLARTLNSVLDQNYPALEYFVQDGGSTDTTGEVLEQYSDRLSGWESAPDTGQSNAINKGFARTSGEIMAWLNSDDILLPGALGYVVDYFNKHPEIDVVYGHRLLIDENDQLIGRWIMPEHDDKILSWVDYIPQETMFWRRRIWDKAGGQIDENFRFAMDWDLILRFRENGAKFARLPRALGGFRIHEQQKTSAVISQVGYLEMDQLRQRVLGKVPNYLEIRRAMLPYLMKHVLVDLQWRIEKRLGNWQ